MEKVYWKILIVFFLICSLNQASAQFSVKIRKSASDESEKEKPAEFNIVQPKDTSGSFVVSGALIFQYQKKWFMLSGNAEWDKNTAIEKEQNNLLAGLNASLYSSKDWANKKWYFHFPMELKFGKDYEKDINSWKIKFNSQFLNNSQSFFLGKDYFGDTIFSHYLYPFLSFEYQNDFNAELEGIKTRFVFSIPYYARLRLLDGDYFHYIKGSVLYTNRTVISNDTEDDEENSDLITLSCGIEVIEDIFEIGWSFYKGADPWKGKENQQYHQFTFKLKATFESN